MTRWMCHKCGSVDPIPEPDSCPVCYSYGYGCDCDIPETERCPNCWTNSRAAYAAREDAPDSGERFTVDGEEGYVEIA